MLCIAESAGAEHKSAQKRRYFRAARGSGFACSAILLICRIRKIGSAELLSRGATWSCASRGRSPTSPVTAEIPRPIDSCARPCPREKACFGSVFPRATPGHRARADRPRRPTQTGRIARLLVKRIGRSCRQNRLNAGLKRVGTHVGAVAEDGHCNPCRARRGWTWWPWSGSFAVASDSAPSRAVVDGISVLSVCTNMTPVGVFFAAS